MPFWTALPELALHKLAANFPALIMSIGQKQFGVKLLTLLNDTCGAEHATVFHLTADNLIEVTAASMDGSDTAHRQVGVYLKEGLWRRDPTLTEAKLRLSSEDEAFVRTDIAHLGDDVLRDIVYGQPDIGDRLLICSRWGDDIVGLSVLRSSDAGPFTSSDINGVQSIAGTIFALLAKHISITWDGPNISVALTSLHEIETCISACASSLPRREAEVCSRIIYGMSTVGISLELNISEETVMTYRKRTYQRLGIATQRELLLWYLDLWSHWQDRATREPAPLSWKPEEIASTS
ncbi:LuxR C-terminal-related transcriptional regulator (plasmid) [Sphingobium sp. SJ10-10]|uniref:Transcriptional regulator, LuxR family n=1 Tax=Sphingomonas sp. NS2 TaxID=908605 RepID=A0A0D4ZZ03_9SPHN|nr:MULTISPECIES: LuxR C-terminal-related transcriptional regulator [unclassified Sphingobium]AJW29379.1 transcriptional regulator, LuxR family [Sphingomonas sp. NS2]AMK26580.1 regulatory protein LuxR [Sphingobium sp. TKS]MEC6699600.1 LuxR C-terminal-related transcriptional regulator [Sphingobium sp. SJ10-10]NML91710.1 helix-turn-helix transcriptional regulator [Sphingobium sp. TB-6]